MISFILINMMVARTKLLLVALGCFALLTLEARASETSIPLRVLYIGHRSADFAPFLKGHFAKVESTSRENFQPQSAKDYHVVLLDWPQGEIARQQRVGTSPLGKREDWAKPTLLLGSAGLNLAVAWKINGGSG